MERRWKTVCWIYDNWAPQWWPVGVATDRVGHVFFWVSSALKPKRWFNGQGPHFSHTLRIAHVLYGCYSPTLRLKNIIWTMRTSTYILMVEASFRKSMRTQKNLWYSLISYALPKVPPFFFGEANGGTVTRSFRLRVRVTWVPAARHGGSDATGCRPWMQRGVGWWSHGEIFA